jgi:hypothetical protein
MGQNSTCAVELQLRVSLTYIQLFQRWNMPVSRWHSLAVYTSILCRLYKELIKPCSIIHTSRLCSLTVRFTWALIYLKSSLRRFSASLYRNSTLRFSLCNRKTFIFLYFWFLYDTLSCCTDSLKSISNSYNGRCQIIGCTVHPALGADCIFLWVVA